MKPKIIDIDRGYKRLAKLADETYIVDVGVMGPQAAAARGRVTMVQIAERHENGEGVPRRSFLQGWLQEKQRANIDFARKVVNKRIDGKINEQKALSLLGLYAVGGIQERISAGIAPANSAATIARKGSSTPLIDTGQLRASISFRKTKT